MRSFARPVLLLFFVCCCLQAGAQSAIVVEVDDVTDNRVAAGEFQGALELRVKLGGNGLDKIAGARVLVKDARDDRGNSLLRKTDPPDFTPREYNSGTLQLAVMQPARSATSVKVKGTVELYVPGRDPNALVKIDKALGKLDAPLSHKALKAAKIEITPLSRAAYAKSLEARKLDETKIAAIREEGKKRGVSEKEIEAVIGLAQAFQMTDADTPANAIILTGSKEDFDRVFRVEVLGADGKPMDLPSRSTSSMGDDTLMTLSPREDPPANASLQLHLLTDKSRMSVPFELNVELP
jgi:hypothetical protein